MADTVTTETRAVLDALLAMGLPPLHTMTPEVARGMRERTAKLASALDPEPVASVVDSTIPGPGGRLPIRTYTPDRWDDEAGSTLVYFHGGGWVMGDLDTHDAPCRGVANAAGFRVMAVQYRLAPEHRHPAALDDAWAATQWMAGQAPGRLFVGGDSAGGHLATCVAARARGSEVKLEGQLLVYPVTDLSRLDTESYVDFAEGYWLTSAAMVWFRDHYLGQGGDPEDPDASPLLRDDLSGMPPAVLIAADCDVLKDEGRVYADRLLSAGGVVDYRFYDGVIHGFFAMPGAIPEGRQAIEDAGRALKALVGRAV